MTEHNTKKEYRTDEEVAEFLMQKAVHINPSEASLKKLLDALPDNIPVASPYVPSRISFFSFQKIMMPAFVLILLISSGAVYFFRSNRELPINNITAMPSPVVAVRPAETVVSNKENSIEFNARIGKQVAFIDTQMPSRFNSSSATVSGNAPSFLGAPSQTSGAVPNKNTPLSNTENKVLQVVNLITAIKPEIQTQIAKAKTDGRDVKSFEYVLNQMTINLHAAIDFMRMAQSGVDSVINTNKAIDRLMAARQNLEQLMQGLSVL